MAPVRVFPFLPECSDLEIETAGNYVHNPERSSDKIGFGEHERDFLRRGRARYVVVMRTSSQNKIPDCATSHIAFETIPTQMFQNA